MNDLLQQSLAAERHVLSNGLTVLLLEDHHLPLISSHTIFKVGSRNESSGMTGISHLFEHMMFNGSKNFPPLEFDRILESNGGYSNAYTSRDMTVYYESFTPALLKTVCHLNADRMGWLTLNDECLESERSIVMEERRLRTDNSVIGRMDEEFYAAAYMAHSYRWPVIGWMSDIQNISLADCQQFYQTYYAPNNAILVVVGDFQKAQALDYIEHYYGDIPSQPPPAAVRTIEPPQRGERRVSLQLPAQLPAFMTAWHVPALHDDHVYTLGMLQVILCDGDSSRMIRSLIHDRALAVHCSVDFSWRLDPSLFGTYVQVAPGHSPEKVEAHVYRLLDQIARHGVTRKEIRKAYNIIAANLVRSMKTLEGKGGKLGVYEAYFGQYEAVFDLLQRYRAVTPEMVQDIVQRYFTEENRTVLNLRPTDNGKPVRLDEDTRAGN